MYIYGHPLTRQLHCITTLQYGLFVAASHQTGLDTRSKAQRPIKVQLFSMARHTERFKLGSKHSRKHHVRLKIFLLSHIYIYIYILLDKVITY